MTVVLELPLLLLLLLLQKSEMQKVLPVDGVAHVVVPNAYGVCEGQIHLTGRRVAVHPVLQRTRLLLQC